MGYTIHSRLKQCLQERGITQKQLSEETGLREATISSICRDTLTSLNLKHIAKIAEALDVQDIREIIELRISE